MIALVIAILAIPIVIGVILWSYFSKGGVKECLAGLRETHRKYDELIERTRKSNEDYTDRKNT